MASAQSYEVNLPDVSVGVNPNMTDKSFGSGSSIWSKAASFFGGVDSKAMYQNALTENNRAYEQALLKESRAYDEYLRQYNAKREDTAIQRKVADLKAAGLNPWLALQGGVSGSSAYSQPAGDSRNISGGSSAKSKNTDEDGSSLAMLLVSIARMLA